MSGVEANSRDGMQSEMTLDVLLSALLRSEIRFHSEYRAKG